MESSRLPLANQLVFDPDLGETPQQKEDLVTNILHTVPY
jgi:hypothetical protein